MIICCQPTQIKDQTKLARFGNSSWPVVTLLYPKLLGLCVVMILILQAGKAAAAEEAAKAVEDVARRAAVKVSFLF